jgi:hypothetical protein
MAAVPSAALTAAKVPPRSLALRPTAALAAVSTAAAMAAFAFSVGCLPSPLSVAPSSLF